MTKCKTENGQLIEYETDSSSSPTEDGESSDDETPESTPAMILRALQSESLRETVYNKWIIDQQTRLSFLYNDGKMYCWNPDSKSMYEWTKGKRMQFLWSSAESGNNNTSSELCVETPTEETNSLEVSQNKFEEYDGNKINKPYEESQLPNTVDETTSQHPKCCRITIIPPVLLHNTSKKRKADFDIVDPKIKKHKREEQERNELIEETEASLVDPFPSFAKKFPSIETNILRHFRKYDLQLQRYIFRHFNPTKGKAKNVLQKFMNGLLKHPQRWRLSAILEDELMLPEYPFDSNQLLEDDSIVIGKESDGIIDLSLIDNIDEGLLTNILEEHCRVFSMGGEFYLLPQDTSGETIAVNGCRANANDGPVALNDCSTICIGNTDSNKYIMMLIEIGSDSDALTRRRLDLSEKINTYEKTNKD